MTDGLLWALIYVFVLTFICYPGLAETSTINFMKDISNYGSWFNLFVQGIFNGLDAVGRYCGGVGCMILSNGSIKVGSAVRTLLIATFLLVAFDITPFKQDWFIILNLAIFSFSNGYVSTLCAVKAPQTVEGEAKGQVGGFIGITISTGIVIGSLLAYAMLQLIKATPEYKDNH